MASRLLVATTSLAMLLTGCRSTPPTDTRTAPPRATEQIDVTAQVAALPEVGDAAATVQFLEGDGAAMLALHEIAEPLADGTPPDPDTCRSIAEAADDQLPAPDRWLELAAQVPDPATSQLLVNEFAAVTELVRRCLSDQLDDENIAEVAELHRIVTARLQQVQP